MQDSRIFTARYIGSHNVINSTDMRPFKERAHKIELEKTFDYLVGEYVTEVYITTFHSMNETTHIGLKRLLTRSSDTFFIQNWDIIDRRVLIEKTGNTW